MAEYIEREAVREEIASLARERFTLSDIFEAYLDGLKDVDMKIRNLPSADVQPVRHGRWILKAGENWYGGGGYECSACKYGYAIGAYHEPDEFTYCPNCGALMDKEIDNGRLRILRSGLL